MCGGERKQREEREKRERMEYISGDELTILIPAESEQEMLHNRSIEALPFEEREEVEHHRTAKDIASSP